ncbi:uncharacterized protein LOC119328537 [Triticum dicoccoides]|uniref:uncharacterized protein LOC119328537 n=1 Tax=Triticum dicoccoides TaxID=85692 RepID=UPI00189153B9|nr:uncharacterized protein LOC119328537 [Triticum dicoccoides]
MRAPPASSAPSRHSLPDCWSLPVRSGALLRLCPLPSFERRTSCPDPPFPHGPGSSSCSSPYFDSVESRDCRHAAAPVSQESGSHVHVNSGAYSRWTLGSFVNSESHNQSSNMMKPYPVMHYEVSYPPPTKTRQTCKG